MKLTSTNRSNDLIVPITNAHLEALCASRSLYVLTPHAPSALAPDSAGHSARRAVALAVLRTEIFSLAYLIMGKEIEAEGFARPTGRRRPCGAPAQARSSKMIVRP